MSDAVRALLAELEYPPSDPRHVIGLVALQLAEALDTNPGSPNIARELRGHLQSLAGFPNDPPGIIDELRARRAVRHVEMLLRPKEPGSA